MIYVVLRNGKMVQYNSGTSITVDDGTITVRTKGKDGKDYLVARFPLGIVERAEFQRPCRVVKTKIQKGVDY